MTTKLTLKQAFALAKSKNDALYAKSEDVPTDNSQLANGEGYLTAVPSEYVTDTELTAKGYQTAAQVKTAAESAASTAVAGLGTVLEYKGSVATYADLPTTGMEAGDTYNVVAANGNVPAGTNYSYVAATSDTAAHWDALGGTVDLSAYAKTADLDGVTDDDINSIYATA